MGKGNKEETSKQFRWTKSMEHLFLEILAEKAQKGNKLSNTFKVVSFNPVAVAISERFQVQCDAKHVENHLRTVKNQWQIICAIQDESGFGWDDNMKMITCDRATYDAAVMATGSFARTFADIDLDNGNQDSVPIDGDNEEIEEVRTNVSSSGTSKHKRKNVQESVVDEQIKFVGEQLGKIANALEQFTTDKTPHLYEEVMSMEEEGFDDGFLCSVFDYLTSFNRTTFTRIMDQGKCRIRRGSYHEGYKRLEASAEPPLLHSYSPIPNFIKYHQKAGELSKSRILDFIDLFVEDRYGVIIRVNECDSVGLSNPLLLRIINRQHNQHRNVDERIIAESERVKMKSLEELEFSHEPGEGAYPALTQNMDPLQVDPAQLHPGQQSCFSLLQPPLWLRHVEVHELPTV
ncbi:hypothetical protein GOBAR_AA38247 [Gossypium barbadense]|uniref:Myb/SANT-like domain-containing protein n=1 Tax=Gossypium barbadense TaxID=3634 RepID=A0A2P5VUG7_GOSBA|nr:hypothetical protein GOBAR_AA38247 [Gossypium barbadense]